MQYDESIRVNIATKSDAAGAESAQEVLTTLRTRHGDLIVLADGIGDRKQRRLAGKLVADTIVNHYRNWDGRHPRQMLIDAIGMANSAALDAIGQDPKLEGMGATVAILHYAKNMVRFAHVGNARVYRQRGNRIDQMTRDHTEAQRLADNKLLPQDQVQSHPKASVLYRAVGVEAVVTVDVSDTFLVEPGDAYLLCSDGLTDTVGDVDIGRAVIRLKPQAACDALVNMTREAGSSDDVSVAIVKFAVPPRATKHFTAGLAGPPQIQRATPGRALGSFDWSSLTFWWKLRLIALGVLVVWFVVLLLLWWLLDPTPAQAATVAMACLPPIVRPIKRPPRPKRARRR